MAALPRHADGRGGHARLGVLDPERQLVDADPGGPRASTPTASSCRWTGGRWSSTPPSPTGWCTWCSPPISPPRWWSAGSAPGTCCATAWTPAARKMFAMAMGMIVAVAPIQIVAGDLHGLNTLEHQPAKIAAMEGHFETRRGAPLILFGMPDNAAEETRYARGGPAPRLADPHPPLGRRGARPEGLAGRPAPEPRDPDLLELPADGRARLRHARPRGLGGDPAAQGPALPTAAGFCAPRWRWRRRASSRCSPAG